MIRKIDSKIQARKGPDIRLVAPRPGAEGGAVKKAQIGTAPAEAAETYVPPLGLVLGQGESAGGHSIKDVANPVDPQDVDTLAAREAALEGFATEEYADDVADMARADAVDEAEDYLDEQLAIELAGYATTGYALDVAEEAAASMPPSLVVADSFLVTAGYAGRCVDLSDAAGVAVVLPLNATVDLPVGFYCVFTQWGAGPLTIAGEGGTTVRAVTSALTTTAQYQSRVARKVGTDEWHVA